ncbi:BTB/POZ domain-containing protein [Drosera capensis]
MSSSREVSTMIKQGFISDPSPSSLIHTKPISPNHPSSSPPSPPPFSSSSPQCRPTLFEMMSDEQHRESQQITDLNRQRLNHRLKRVLAKNPNFSGIDEFGGLGFRDGDVKLTVSSRDGFKFNIDVHSRVLTEKSRFFAAKLMRGGAVAQSVEICDCDDAEVYVEVVILMYSDDLKRSLMGEDVLKVLSLLQVSAALMFDAGILSCLEYLQSVPWSDDDEERVISCLSHLQLRCPMTDEVLRRVLPEPSTSTSFTDVFVKLLTSVLRAKDEKSRKEMKGLIFRLLAEDASENRGSSVRLNVPRDTLYHLCHECLSSLILCLSEATCIDETVQDRGAIMGQIAREADNLQWIVDILIKRKMGDEFVKLWADQKELAVLHSKIPTMYRHEISGVTAQLCNAIGRGQILVPRSIRHKLLSTWLEPLYDDFRWMRRASRYIDKSLLEDGLSQTILTLSMPQQQKILLNWFDRFLEKGDDCPNVRRAFEIWWRRAFIRQYDTERDHSEMQITVYDYST